MTVWARVDELDKRLMARAIDERHPRLDRAFVTITEAANYSRLWVAIATVLALVGGARGRRAARRGLRAVALAAFIANIPAKLLVRRRRPSAPDEDAHLVKLPGSTSFPSGHSASSAAFAIGVCAELPLMAPLLVPLAGSVAYSRVHTGVHYPSDVAAGIAIGVACAAAAGKR
jgi:undecaprenyl-diphosphatase